MTNADLRAEIEALRREIAALRAERTATARTEEAAAGNSAEPGAANFVDQLHTLAGEISALAEETEKGVANHPLTSVLAALVLGILIGRAIHR